MKYLLIAVLVLAVVWLWRQQRQARQNEAARESQRKAPRPSSELTPIVACQVCQVHLPRADALPGPQGFYCSDAHRRQAGR